MNDIEKKEKGELKKDLSLFDLIMMGFGCLVGGGIFVLIGKIIYIGGRNFIYGFIFIAILSIIMGLVYIECYSRYKSGITEFLVVKESLGDNMGKISKYFIYFYIIFTSITVIVAITKYLGYFNGSYLKQVTFSITVLFVIMIINLSGIKISKNISIFIGSIIAIIFSFLVFKGYNKITLKRIGNSSKSSWDSFILATILSLFLFNGFVVLIKMSSEAKEEKDMKKAVIFSLGITSFFYIMIVLILISVIGYMKLKKVNVPISKIYNHLVNKKVSTVIFIIGAFILFNTALVKLIAASRFLYGLGESKDIIFNEQITKLNDKNAPKNAIIVTFIISVLCALLNNEILLAVITNFTALFNLIIMASALLILRWRERDDEKKQKENNYIKGNIRNIPVIVVIVLIILLYFMFTLLKNKFWIGSKLIE